MHKSPWKRAFFILLGLNILFVLVLLWVTRPNNETSEFPQKNTLENPAMELSLNGEGFEALINRELKKSGEDVRFSIDDTFNFAVPIEAYGFKSTLIVRAVPSVTEEGVVRMAIKSMDLGGLPLPEEASLALFSRIVNREGMTVESSHREILLDPATLLKGTVAGDFRIKELNLKEDRYVFEGQLGVS
nr:DUF2140 family protein [uncultured Peptoniphilus sp.]